MSTIYEDVKAIEELLEEYQDKISNTPMGQMDSISDWLEQTRKEIISNGLEKLCKVRANKIANIFSLKEEEKRLAEKRKREEAKLERLESYIAQILYETGKRKQEAGTFTVSFRKSTSCFVCENALKDDRFITIEEVKKIDKMGIKQALQNGEKIEGAYLLEKDNLQVK